MVAVERLVPHSIFCGVFLRPADPGAIHRLRLRVATARRAKQHFAAMSVTSTVQTNQRVCHKEA